MPKLKPEVELAVEGNTSVHDSATDDPQALLLSKVGKDVDQALLKKYMGIRILTDSLTVAQLEELAAGNGLEQFMADYNQWVKLGAPSPKMPAVSRGIVPVPTAIYRNCRGKADRLYARYSDGSYFGLQYEKVFVKHKSPKTGKVTETTVLKNFKTIYTQKWDAKKAKEILAEAEKLTETGEITCYAVLGGEKREVSAEQLLMKREDLEDAVHGRLRVRG